MGQKKQKIVHVLRQIGLLEAADKLHLQWAVLRTKDDNAAFCREHPDFRPPPIAIMHDAYGQTSLRSYWNTGKLAAEFLADLIRKHAPEATRVMEWGCGSARTLRHLPGLLPQGVEYFGSDYNPETVAWCRANINGVSFIQNDLSPPLPLESSSIDVIYAISVLTHLSVAQQHAWLKELRRVLRPGGCLILTTNGEQSAKVLLPHERAQLKADGVYIRSGVEEGKRCFLSYHLQDYVTKQLFAGMTVREFIPGSSPTAIRLWGRTDVEQDTWVLQ
jgi:SAM-dependent methyltransferase